VTELSLYWFPAAWLVIAGLVLRFLPMLVRQLVVLTVPLLTLAAIWYLPDGQSGILELGRFNLTPIKIDALSRLFATAFCVALWLGSLFAFNRLGRGELSAGFVYAGSAVGVVFAGDMLTLFGFWELMALASMAVIWTGRQPGSFPVSMRYMLVHLLGGAMLLAGIAGHLVDTGSLEFTTLELDSIPHALIFAGFLINAGAPPFWSWIADAYPKASPAGTVFLSAFTTKTAVYVVIRAFAGESILIPIGLSMVVYGVLYAMRENDLRRLMAYSIVGQVGFMLTAVGIGTDLAINGAAAHAFAHILYKALLLMSAGAVIYATGSNTFAGVGGLAKRMPLVATAAVVGALSLSALPLTGGFVSKSLLMQATIEAHLTVAWVILLVASSVALLYVGLRYPWFVFFNQITPSKVERLPWNMTAAIVLTVVACVALGLFSATFFSVLPYPIDYQPYTFTHVIEQLQLLLGGVIVFYFARGYLQPRDTVTLDVDWLYRHWAPNHIHSIDLWLSETYAGFLKLLTRLQELLVQTLRHWHSPEALFGRNWGSGPMVLITLVVFVLVLVVFLR